MTKRTLLPQKLKQNPKFTLKSGLNLSLNLGLLLSLPALASELNDTGLGDNNYSTEETNYYFERLEMTDFPGQDPQYGRDAAAAEDQLSKVGGGHRGFDFSDHNDCIKDNVTGLIWEAKTDAAADDLQSNKWTYTWYDENRSEHEGRQNGGVCHNPESEDKDRIRCDTTAYMAKMNEIELCGYNDWRLPNREELRSIVDYSEPNVNTLDYERIHPSIDLDYFPNTLGSGYWTANVYVGDKKRMWTVDFEHGGDSNQLKNRPAPIRVVSDAERDKTNETNERRYEVHSSQTMNTEMNAQTNAEMDTEKAQEMARDKADISANEEEPGILDRIMGVFDDDDDADVLDDTSMIDENVADDKKADAKMAEEASMEAVLQESAPEDVEMNRVPDVAEDTEREEAESEELGFFQKVKDLF